jgi:hypothetical protein
MLENLYVLCMIFMVLSCVLCMTLILFIYVYYGLFTCTNLVDVISLFFTVFSFHLPIFDKKWPIFGKNRPDIATPFFLKNRPIYRSNRPIYRCYWFHCSSVISGVFRPNFPNFRRFLPIFSKNRRDR